jgi:hypothetical protein
MGLGSSKISGNGISWNTPRRYRNIGVDDIVVTADDVVTYMRSSIVQDLRIAISAVCGGLWSGNFAWA